MRAAYLRRAALNLRHPNPMYFNGILYTKFGTPFTMKPLDYGSVEKSRAGDFQASYLFAPFSHSAIIHPRTAITMMRAIPRLCGARLSPNDAATPDEDLEYDDMLAANQDGFADSIYVRDLRTHILYHGSPCDEPNLISAVTRWANESKQKRAMRCAFARDLSAGKVSPTFTYKEKCCEANIKYEVAKPRKYARLFVSFDPKAAALTGYVISYLKHALEHPYRLPGFYWRFVAVPTHDQLTDLFSKIVDGFEGCSYVSFSFSDDNILRVRDHMFTLDISSCDRSIGPALAEYITTLGVDSIQTEALRLIIDMLSWPVRFRNPDQPSETCKLQPVRPMLYSGSTITTVINTIASAWGNLSAYEQVSLLPQNATLGEITTAITRGWHLAGFEVEINAYRDYAELDFLKHFPIRTEGIYYPVLESGVIFRSFGRRNGFLAFQREGFDTVGRRFCADLVAGYKHSGNYFLTNSLRQNFPPSQNPTFTSWLLQEVVGTSRDVPVEEWNKRYKLTPAELQELILLVEAHTFGTFTACSAIDKILAKDYGLSPANEFPVSESQVIRLKI